MGRSIAFPSNVSGFKSVTYWMTLASCFSALQLLLISTCLPGRLGGIHDLMCVSTCHSAGGKVRAAAEGKAG